jgi:hypothetical protein
VWPTSYRLKTKGRFGFGSPKRLALPLGVLADSEETAGTDDENDCHEQNDERYEQLNDLLYGVHFGSSKPLRVSAV